ncbi:MAG: TrmH family RNA methyltransferase [Bacteroidetes bacterium]|nr:MAG: TrmH family RNA methyltransferase [Bacteroidota bacterium]
MTNKAMSREIKQQLLEFYNDYLTDRRKARFEEVIKYRTRYITVVLEDVFQSHNASAVLRSCDLTGIQDIHAIENRNEYDVNTEIDMGSSKWLNLYRYNQKKHNTLDAYQKLKKEGYRIIATTPHKNDFTPENLPLEGKFALVFGTELTGLSDIAIEQADEFLRIPMVGFTESYNISVSAALSVYTLSERLRKSNIPWQLSTEEREDILLEWARRSVRSSENLEHEFFKRISVKK